MKQLSKQNFATHRTTKKSTVHKRLIITILTAILLIVVVIFFLKIPEKKEFPVKGELDDYSGEISVTNGNLNNKSFITTTKDKCYFATYFDGLKIKDMNSDSILDYTNRYDIVQYFSDDKDYVYFLACNREDDTLYKNDSKNHNVMYNGGSINRINKKDGKLEKIYTFDDSLKIANLFKKGNWFYYIASGSQGGLFRVNIESLVTEQLVGLFSDRLNYHSERFYYLESNKYDIVSIDLLGRDKKVLWENSKYRISDFIIDNNRLYCVTKYNDETGGSISEIFVLDMDTLNKETLVKTTEEISTINVMDNTLYYVVDDENIETTGDELVSYDFKNDKEDIIEKNVIPHRVNLIDSYLYYFTYIGEGKDTNSPTIEFVKYGKGKKEIIENYR